MQIYIHIPFCERKCNYCDFLSGPADPGVREMYVNALIKEIRGRAANVGREEKITTIYFGGGTPSVLSAKQLGDILFTVCQEYTLDNDVEITIEVNPKSADRDKLHFLRANGFNRLSIGMQSIHRSELELLGRIHTFDDFVTCFQNARDTGFSNISVDVMTAIPGQSGHMLSETLDRVIGLGPEHISTYSLTIERGTPFFEQFGDIEGPVIGEEAERRLYWMTVDKMSDNGYKHYEISNFAKPGFESRHNTGYWKRKHYLGMGLGASSCEEVSEGDVRSRNTTDLETYLANPMTREESSVLTKNEMIEETMYLGLRMMDGVDTDEFERKFGVTVRSIYGDVIDDLVAQGLIYEGSNSLSLTDLGIDYGNHVFSKFLR